MPHANTCATVHGHAVRAGDDRAFIAALVTVAQRADLRELGAAARQAVEHLHPDQVAVDFSDLLVSLDARSLAA